MITVDEARTKILAGIEPLEPERLPLVEAVGRVLAADLIAEQALPAWDNSAMDGYAVRAADLPAPGTPVAVTLEIPAGSVGDQALAPGSAARIFTGAPVPPGADTVIIQENAVRDGDRVTFQASPRPGANVRRAGNDVEVGQPLLRAGRPLQAGDLLVLAGQGRAFVQVHRAPVVSLVSSGDELVEVDGRAPGRGQIRNGNALALAAAVRELGAVPRVHPILRDDYDATVQGLQRAAAADAVICTGGVSVGDYDFVGRALNALCDGGLTFWKVALKPGKPLAFGHLGRCAAFGLPGNPVSALVTFELFVRPALLRLMGHRRVLRPVERAVLTTSCAPGGPRPEYRRAEADWSDGQLHVDPSRTQSSGALSSMAGADVLLIVPAGAPGRPAGTEVDVIRLGTGEALARQEAPSQ